MKRGLSLAAIAGIFTGTIFMILAPRALAVEPVPQVLGRLALMAVWNFLLIYAVVAFVAWIWRAVRRGRAAR